MALYLPENDCVFLHIPRTAGHWREAALKRYDVDVESIVADPKVHQKTALSIYFRSRKTTRHRCAFVRDPVDWYESWWSFANTEGSRWNPPNLDDPWEPTQLLPPMKSDFNEWVWDCINTQPAFVTRMYEWYLGPTGLTQVDFVGRFENLVGDFHSILELTGISISNKSLHSIPKQNESEPAKKPHWKPETLGEVMRMEHVVYDRFYYKNKNVLEGKKL